MEFDLSEDQAALGDAARALLDGQAGPDRVRAHLQSGRPWDDGLWRAMVDQGWLAVAVPEDRGGLGLSWVEAVVLLEEVGRRAAPAPLLPTMLAASCLAETPWGSPLAAGEAVGCVGWTGRPDAVVVQAGPGGARLTGRLDPVVAADGADVAVVWTPDALFAVDLAACGP
ncbi:MAG: acyl-CoA dehydrogenase family protein, partial [Acidimicrobiales bacterium]